MTKETEGPRLAEHEAPAATQIDPVLTIPEVAADLRCSKAHVYKVVRSAVPGISPLPVIEIGRRKLVRRSSLERWKRANEKTGSDDMLTASLEVDAV